MKDEKHIIDVFHRKWLQKSNGYIGNPQKTRTLLAKVARMFSRDALQAVLSDLKCLHSYVRDISSDRYKGYSKANLALAVGVLVYVVSPLDLVPDFLVGIGLADDATLIAWACRQLHEELTAYRQWQADNPPSQIQ